MTGRGRSRGTAKQQQAEAQARTGGGRGRVSQPTPFTPAPALTQSAWGQPQAAAPAPVWGQPQAAPRTSAWGQPQAAAPAPVPSAWAQPSTSAHNPALGQISRGASEARGRGHRAPSQPQQQQPQQPQQQSQPPPQRSAPKPSTTQHMIFMGSEKFPGENEFDQFMQKSGGSINASTDSDETVYFFETQEAFLDEAADRFSQFFKAPLMLKEAMTREREAVESEFASKKNGDAVRRGQLLSLIGQQHHPATTFAWGNLETLKNNIDDDVLYRKVHDFRKRHYSAHRMYVCLQSKLSLDDLQAEGFSQKLHLILDVFSKCLKSLADDSTEQQFDVFVQQQFKSYENVFLRPEALSKELCLNIIQSHDQPLYEKNKRLRSITFADFQQFCRNFCKQVRIKALVQGNVTEERALNAVHSVLNELDCGRVEDISSIELLAAKLPIGARYLRCKTFDPADTNTFTTKFYQIGPDSHITRALIDLLVMVARAPLFDTLRNKEQLAYYVSFSLRGDFGILGYSIVVNSQEPKFSVDYVDERIENFRYELIAFIKNLSDDDFDAMKAPLAKNKLNHDNKLSDEVSRNCTEITTDAYQFDRPHREVESLSTITKSQLLEFYLTHYGDNDRQLSVQVIGNAHAQANEPDLSNDVGTELEINGDSETQKRMRYDPLSHAGFYGESRGGLITDLMEFRKSLELYPVIRSN